MGVQSASRSGVEFDIAFCGCDLQGLRGDENYEDRVVGIDFQNENLVAWEGDTPLATVPDLIRYDHIAPVISCIRYCVHCSPPSWPPRCA